MSVRTVKAIIHAMIWMLVGMVFMARMYCVALNITSGSMFIGWDTIVFTLGGLLAVQVMLWLDPSFRDQR